ncbi:hypothetical protein KFL_008030030 [Klebsormidium nitens]|uniref:Uncharacterized protein n=1 Tax=Klebsormidium nitens TaxID=105231 RepID=A0A1Y1IQL7_KLENI|nr:hypothetical protein KFL_008030030 [Klebsormidium nitens]|eukprot:GAQ91541.1 hypothetical protein KFL_008030030 [Klebsormidium nitens]
MLRRPEISVSGIRRHVEKATCDELNGRGNAGVFPVSYIGGVHVDVQFEPNFGHDAGSPRATLRSNIGKADVLAQGSMRIEASEPSSEAQEIISGSGSRMANSATSAGHVSVDDNLTTYQMIVGAQRRTCSEIDMREMKYDPSDTRIVSLTYSNLMRQGHARLRQQPDDLARRRTPFLSQSVPLMLDPLTERLYGGALSVAGNPDLAVLPGKFTGAAKEIRKMVPSSAKVYLNSLSDTELRQKIVLGGAGYPSTRTIKSTTKEEMLEAYPEAILKSACTRQQTLTGIADLVGKINTIFTAADGDTHVFSVGRVLGSNGTVAAHTANGLRRFSGAGLGFLGPLATTGGISFVHVAPAQGISGEYNLALDVDGLGVVILFFGDVLPEEDDPDDNRWNEPVGREQKTSWIMYILANLPQLLGAPADVRAQAFSVDRQEKRNVWLQAAIEEAEIIYKSSRIRGEATLMSEAARALVQKEEVWRGLEEYMPVTCKEFVQIAAMDAQTEQVDDLCKAMRKAFSSKGPLQLSFLYLPTGVFAKTWEELFGLLEMLTKNWDGWSRFEKLKPDWTAESVKDMQLGIYGMEAALYSKKKREAERCEAMQQLKDALRARGIAEENVEVLAKSVEATEPPWNAWEGIDRRKAFDAAKRAVLAAGDQFLEAKETFVPLEPVPPTWDLGLDGTCVQAAETDPASSQQLVRARVIFKQAINLVAQVLRGDFTIEELQTLALKQLPRRPFLIDLVEHPINRQCEAEMYELARQQNTARCQIGPIVDLFETYNIGGPFPNLDGRKLHVLRVECVVPDVSKKKIAELAVAELVTKLEDCGAFGRVALTDDL